MVGGPVAGKPLPERAEFEGEPCTGVFGRGLGNIGRPENEYCVGDVGRRVADDGDKKLHVSSLLSVGDSVAGRFPVGTDSGGMGSTLLCR